MSLIDGDGNSYSDMADYHLQLADSGQQMSDEKFFNPVIQRESNWQTGPSNRTGSNVGLGQYGPEELKRYHITDPDSPEQTYRAMRMERGEQQGILRQKGYKGPYGPGEFGMIHNQGLGGGPAILTADPNARMGDVLKPFYPGKSVKYLNQVIGQKANWGDVNTPAGEWRNYAIGWYAGGHPDKPRTHISVTPSSYDDMPTDRNHDIPLIAGARMSDDGEYKGIYMDRSIPDTMTMTDGTNSKSIPSDMFVKLHEWEEVQDMERAGGTLSKNRSGKAYSLSHSTVATPREQAAVEKWASDNGLEPKKTWKNYQEFWKNALSVTEKEPPQKVPSDLYLHPYDGHKYQKEMEELSGRSIANHPKLREDQIVGKESIGKKPDSIPRREQTRAKGQYVGYWDKPGEMPGYKAEKDAPDIGMPGEVNTDAIQASPDWQTMDSGIFKGYGPEDQTEVGNQEAIKLLPNVRMNSQDAKRWETESKIKAITDLMKKALLTGKGSKEYEKQRYSKKLPSRYD